MHIMKSSELRHISDVIDELLISLKLYIPQKCEQDCTQSSSNKAGCDVEPCLILRHELGASALRAGTTRF